MPRRPSPKKPDRTTIRNAVPLTLHPRRPEDLLSACNLCGVPGPLDKNPQREHDEHDVPVEGDGALVFLGERPAHVLCHQLLEDHPRLYARVRGNPGHLPVLCGPCVWRSGLGCRHPDLKSNGGRGLNVGLTNGLPPNAIICPPPKIVPWAVSCSGFADAGES